MKEKIKIGSKIFIQDTVENCYLSYSSFEKIQVFFIINGYELVGKISDADIAVINTCGGDRDTQKIIRNTIEYLNKNNIYTLFFGCFELITKFKDNLKFNYDLIYTNRSLVVDNIFNFNTSINNITSIDIDKYKKYLVKGNFVKRYFIEIERGCIHKCSYCPIKKSIGYVKSKSINDILYEFKYAVGNGYNEIVLLGEDAGSYGIDIGTTLPNLFSELVKIKGDYKINIHQFEPSMMIKYFNEMKEYLPIISKIILSAQSFNDRILKLMGRKYTVIELVTILKEIKKYNKTIILENQMIYGYPTETFDEFKNNFKYMHLYKENIFNKYSHHEGIKKYSDNDILDNKELYRREKILLELSQKHTNISISWNGEIYPWQHKGKSVKCTFNKH